MGLRARLSARDAPELSIPSPDSTFGNVAKAYVLHPDAFNSFSGFHERLSEEEVRIDDVFQFLLRIPLGTPNPSPSKIPI